MRLRLLIALQGFNALTAIAGGIGLIAGWINPGREMLSHTDFASYYWPGVILLCIVGGSALFACLSLLRRLQGTAIISLLAGTIMLFWIICEVASIRQFHFLQALYIVISLAIIYLSEPKISKK